MNQFNIPVLPQKLAQQQAAINGCLPAPGARYNSKNWMQTFVGDPDLMGILKKFPSPISRNQVASLYGGGNFRQLFLASMIWGHTTRGYGPYRTRLILGHPQTHQVIQTAVGLVVANKIKSAYESMSIPGLGSAFFTKFLYFVGLGANIRPLPVILDTTVAGAFERMSVQGGWKFTDFANVTRNKDGGIGYIKPFGEGYMRYVDTVNQWSKQLGCPPDHVEYFMFRYC